jgi:cytochrome c-type protein NapB
MKPHQLLKISLVCAAGLWTNLALSDATSADSLGLQKGSVFDIAIPIPPAFPEQGPGQNDFLGAAHSGEPPQIPHSVDQFLPIRMGTNRCVGCHDKPMLIGKVRGRKGIATPAPASHYMDWRHGATEASRQLQGSRYLCVQCHRPQANAPALVDNTFAN